MVSAMVLLSFVTLQRGVELAWSRANTARLKALGAVEVGAAHYPAMVVLHGLWLASLWVFGWNRALVWPWVGVFALLQAGRAWVLATLRRRWTTRVFVVPGETLVSRGPYRFVRHPNYLVVVAEIFVTPLALGLTTLALLFGAANCLMLAWRVRVENRALDTVSPEP